MTTEIEYPKTIFAVHDGDASDEGEIMFGADAEEFASMYSDLIEETGNIIAVYELKGLKKITRSSVTLEDLVLVTGEGT